MRDPQRVEEIARLYSTYGDAELLELAAAPGELTDEAQEALGREMRQRDLKAGGTADSSTNRRREHLAESGSEDEEEAEAAALDRLRNFAALAPEECVWEFSSLPLANASSHALRASGILSVLTRTAGYTNDQEGARLVVAPSDAAEAARILALPLSEEFLEDGAVNADFAEPVCPACASSDIVLESVDPENEWHCDACGHDWVESVQV